MLKGKMRRILASLVDKSTWRGWRKWRGMVRLWLAQRCALVHFTGSVLARALSSWENLIQSRVAQRQLAQLTRVHEQVGGEACVSTASLFLSPPVSPLRSTSPSTSLALLSVFRALSSSNLSIPSADCRPLCDCESFANLLRAGCPNAEESVWELAVVICLAQREEWLAAQRDLLLAQGSAACTSHMACTKGDSLRAASGP